MKRRPPFSSHLSPHVSKPIPIKNASKSGAYGVPSSASNSGARSTCQICKGTNHQALDCFRRMDFSFQGRHPPADLAAMVADINAEFMNTQWLADSGANAHVTNDDANLDSKRAFDGSETVGVGNGSGLHIKHTGSSLVFSNNNQFLLNHIVHCPQATTNLLSINKFCVDNDVTFHFTHNSYSIQDNQMGLILLRGPSENGLYPINLSNLSHNKRRGLTAFVGIKASSSLWHSRLGYPSESVLSHVLHTFNLPLDGSIKKAVVCESCQLGKSIQQPFSSSHRESSSPLELVHSDVWVAPFVSISGFKFYVIFIDDFSRHTWLYPISHKSDVFSSFIQFRLLVEK